MYRSIFSEHMLIKWTAFYTTVSNIHNCEYLSISPLKGLAIPDVTSLKKKKHCYDYSLMYDFMKPMCNIQLHCRSAGNIYFIKSTGVLATAWNINLIFMGPCIVIIFYMVFNLKVDRILI